jgi:hypothetical protein
MPSAAAAVRFSLAVFVEDSHLVGLFVRRRATSAAIAPLVFSTGRSRWSVPAASPNGGAIQRDRWLRSRQRETSRLSARFNRMPLPSQAMPASARLLLGADYDGMGHPSLVAMSALGEHLAC